MTNDEHTRLCDLITRMEAGHPLRRDDLQVLPIVSGWAASWRSIKGASQPRYRMLMPGEKTRDVSSGASACKVLREKGWADHARAMIEEET